MVGELPPNLEELLPVVRRYHYDPTDDGAASLCEVEDHVLCHAGGHHVCAFAEVLTVPHCFRVYLVHHDDGRLTGHLMLRWGGPFLTPLRSRARGFRFLDALVAAGAAGLSSPPSIPGGRRRVLDPRGVTAAFSRLPGLPEELISDNHATPGSAVGSVLPTPVGPVKKSEPHGRSESFSPALKRLRPTGRSEGLRPTGRSGPLALGGRGLGRTRTGGVDTGAATSQMRMPRVGTTAPRSAPPSPAMDIEDMAT